MTFKFSFYKKGQRNAVLSYLYDSDKRHSPCQILNFNQNQTDSNSKWNYS